MKLPRILDTHVHFWDPRTTPRAVSPLVKTLGRFPRMVDWIAMRVFPHELRAFYGSPEYVTRTYLSEQFERDCGSYELQGLVHVEAGWEAKGPLGPVGETAWLESLTTTVPILGMVVGADLTLGAEVLKVLEAHQEASTRVRGVRNVVFWHPSQGVMSAVKDPRLLENSAWLAGYEQIRKQGLHFETACYHHQLPDLAKLARAYPEQPVVLCHAGTPLAIGGPYQDQGCSAQERERVDADWREGMAELAASSNVSVKVSGLTMPACGFGFEHRSSVSIGEMVDRLAPLIEFVLKTFGAQRCMFGSNFPVDKISSSYGDLLEVLSQATAGLGAQEREDFFGANAARLYRLNGAEHL